jgi:outer membrane protein assembly factor BamB
VLGLGLAACGGLANSPWPKFQSQTNNNGASPAGSVSGVIQHKFPFPFGGQSFDPAIGPDGTVYVGHQLGPTGTLYALDGPTLALKWPFPLDISGPLDTPGVFISAPAIRSDGTIFLAASAGSQGRVYSLDQSNGHINWEFDPGGLRWTPKMRQ